MALPTPAPTTTRYTGQLRVKFPRTSLEITSGLYANLAQRHPVGEDDSGIVIRVFGTDSLNRLRLFHQSDQAATVSFVGPAEDGTIIHSDNTGSIRLTHVQFAPSSSSNGNIVIGVRDASGTDFIADDDTTDDRFTITFSNVMVLPVVWSSLNVSNLRNLTMGMETTQTLVTAGRNPITCTVSRATTPKLVMLRTDTGQMGVEVDDMTKNFLVMADPTTAGQTVTFSNIRVTFTPTASSGQVVVRVAESDDTLITNPPDSRPTHINHDFLTLTFTNAAGGG